MMIYFVVSSLVVVVHVLLCVGVGFGVGVGIVVINSGGVLAVFVVAAIVVDLSLQQQ